MQCIVALRGNEPMLKGTVADNSADTLPMIITQILKQQKRNNRTVFLLHINHLENSHSHRADRVFELQNALHLIAPLKIFNRATVYFLFVLENA